VVKRFNGGNTRSPTWRCATRCCRAGSAIGRPGRAGAGNVGTTLLVRLSTSSRMTRLVSNATVRPPWSARVRWPLESNPACRGTWVP